MILGADCTVGITTLGSARVFALDARLDEVEAERAVEVQGSTCLRLDRAGRVVGIYCTGALPEGVLIGAEAVVYLANHDCGKARNGPRRAALLAGLALPSARIRFPGRRRRRQRQP